jgi:hypothetical protein
MAKAARLAGGDQEAEAPPQEMAHPGQEAVVAAGVQQDGAEGADLDPPAIEEQSGGSRVGYWSSHCGGG